MALEVKVGSFTKVAATGNQAITGLGFQPKALIVFPSGTATAIDTTGTGGGFDYFGMSDGTDEFTLGMVSTSTRAAGGGKRTTKIVGRHDTNGLDNAPLGELVSLDADGFTINWTSGAAANVVVQYMALGGSDLTNVKLLNDILTPASTGAQALTGAGFEPDACIVIGMRTTSSAAGDQGMNGGIIWTSYGFCDSSLNQFVRMQNTSDGASPNFSTGTFQATGAVLVGTSTQPQANHSATVQSFDSDGLTLDWTKRSHAHRFSVLCLKGGSYYAGSRSQATATGTQSITGVGFQPKGLFLVGNSTVNDTAGATNYTGSLVNSIGMMTDTNTEMTMMKLQNSSPSTLAYRWSSTNAIWLPFRTTGSTLVVANYQGGTSDGFDLNYTTVGDANARDINFFAIGDSAGGGADISESHSLGMDDEASANKFTTRVASSTLAMTQTNIGSARLTRSASSTLALTHSVQKLGVSNVGATQTIPLTQAVIASRSILVATSQLIVTSSASVATRRTDVAVESDLTLTDEAYIRQDASSSFDPTHEAVGELAPEYFAQSDLDMTVEALGVLADRYDLLDELSLEDLAEGDLLPALRAESTLTMTQSAGPPPAGVSEILLSDSADFVPFPSTRFSVTTLGMNDEALSGKTANRSLVSTLALDHAAAVITSRPNRCSWDGVDVPAGTLDRGLKLVGDGEWEVDRSMNFGDIDRMAFDRINRETRGGTLIVFASPIWPKVETLVFSISGISRTEAQDFLTFNLANLGRQITLETHEGRQWEGIIMNPSDVVTEDRKNSFTVSIEFEGTLLEA